MKRKERFFTTAEELNDTGYYNTSIASGGFEIWEHNSQKVQLQVTRLRGGVLEAKLLEDEGGDF